MATTMNAQLRELVTFHMTGSRASLPELGASDLRPALIAGYRNLAELRYDFPLVLVDDGSVRSLTRVINDLLASVAPQGIAGEKRRKQVLRVDAAIRAMVAEEGAARLGELWSKAEHKVRADTKRDARDALIADLRKVRASLKVDGQLLDCAEATAAQVVTHAWKATVAKQRRGALEQIDALILGLTGILEADRMKSAAGRTAAGLERGVGTGFQDAFDFTALSQILTDTAPTDLLSPARRDRVAAALEVLESQRFFTRGDGYDFICASCSKAITDFKARLPEIAAVVKAIAIAELELDNRYRDHKHDSFFADFDAKSLVAEDLARFPSYLVITSDAAVDDSEMTRLFETMSAPVPINVLVQSDDLLADGEQIALGKSTTLDLARMAVGAGEAFVLQSAASNLYQLAEHVSAGLDYAGPALFSVFTAPAEVGLPTYLATAAAMQSRAFPAFVYDPSAGEEWAARFSIATNPAVDVDWPAQTLTYEDDDMQAVSADVAFTFVDFAACDSRFRDHLVVVPRDQWVDEMVPAAEYLAGNGATSNQLPYLWMVDEDDRLHRVVVDATLIRAARRCSGAWHILQEQGGVNNSHAARLVAIERAAWEDDKAKELAALRSEIEEKAALVIPATEAAPAASAAAEVEAAPAGPIEEAFIETVRCTTCNECTEKNGKMFVYNDNKQAVIADLKAGTFRQLVEAAEACKVAIIHPGKPWDMEEADIDELIKRAASFN